MWEVKVEPDVISYSAGISACEKGEQWQRALALLREMRKAQLEPNTVSYNAGISACEKGLQWQRALALLLEMRDAKLEPDAICLQRWGQRLREKPAAAEGCDAVQRDAGGEAGAYLSYNAGIGAGEKGEQWQRALALFSEMRHVHLEPDVTSYSAGIYACELGGAWLQALSFLGETRWRKFDPDFHAYGIVVSMCEQGGQWKQALSLLSAAGGVVAV
ncbi:unnamed protein product [Prorocentrum cordatum]|uniref:Pentatricopeptide repeat-containing protein, chloroplastic n=1 Tax=Prorocentrum cordatum TaxID=2364126 RepID=A0ABN9X9Z8_9DINO|nr:unnamed protein product [Polarella glacialis]